MMLTAQVRVDARHRGRAYTLIEVLVVVAVVGVLAGLLIPAVQSARESARRAQCANNLKQLGLALNSYESASSVFPQGLNGAGYSPHAVLLPFLEQKPLFDSLNFLSDAVKGTLIEYGSNLTVFMTSLAVFHCPSDLLQSGAPGQTNYACNGGVGSFWLGFNGLFVDNAIPSHPSIGFSSVRDGASHTAAAAEWVIGRFEEMNPRGIVFRTETFSAPDEFEPFVSACQGQSIPGAGFSAWSKSAQWLIGGYDNTLLNHNLAINGHSCTVNGFINAGTWTAGSRHAGNGANTLFLDGHVQFIRDSIDLATWRALSTRSGGEVISGW